MNTLIVITGPTGVGKSDLAIALAERLGTEIISADSRQIYADIPVTTAAPSDSDLRRVPHHLVRCLPLDAYFSASAFEQQALNLLPGIFSRCDGTAIVCGGAMMYIDALCNGIDEIPTISPAIRAEVLHLYETCGAEEILARLQQLDPEYYERVDRKNLKRVIHALEICLQSGTTYTSLRTGKKMSRDFRILKFMLTAPREHLFSSINSRVLRMLENGMIDEARAVYAKRELNSLNTVGFKEIFKHFDGEWNLPTAIARLQKNTRVYAKKQLTWYARDPEIISIDVTSAKSPEEIILSYL